MSYFAAVTRSGVRVSMPYPSGPGCPVVFSSKRVTSITLPVSAGQGLDLVAADVGGTQIAVCIGSDDYGYLVRCDPPSVERITPGPVHGRYAIQIEPDGVVSWVPHDNPYVVRYLDGREPTYSRDTNHPLSADATSRLEIAPGLVVTRVVRSGRWTLGEWIAAPDGTTVLYASDGTTAYEVWRGYAPLPASIVEHPDGEATVAVSLAAGSVDPVFVYSYAFTPITAAPAPPVVVPTFPSTSQTIGVGVMDEPDAPILVGWNQPRTPSSVGLFCTANRDDMARVRATSRYVDVPLYVYWDEPEYQHTAEGDEIGAAQAYPRAGESRESFRARLHRAVDAGARCFVFAAYCQWNGATYTLSEQIALDSERDVWDVAVARGVTALWGFVYSRGDGIDGLVRWPSLQESVRRMRAASDDWSVFPAREIEPAPAPEPPAEPEPSPAPEPAPNPEPMPTPEPLVRIQIGNQWSVMPRSQALAIQAQQWATVQAMRANMPPGWEPAPLPPLEPVEREH